MKKTIERDKIFFITGGVPVKKELSFSSQDEVLIGYKGEGMAPIPKATLKSLYSEAFQRNKGFYIDPIDILKRAIKDSQYVEFEEIPRNHE